MKQMKHKETVKTVEDIKKVLKAFRESRNETTKYTVNIGDENIQAETKSASLYDILLDGFKLVEQKIEAIEKAKKQIHESELSILNRFVTIWDVDNMKLPVDALIKDKLDGKRKGLRVRWELSDGIYELDPFTRKVYKVENE